VLLNVPAEVQKFVGDGTKLDANPRVLGCLPELLDKVWVL
jgi:hypothetical protein